MAVNSAAIQANYIISVTGERACLQKMHGFFISIKISNDPSYFGSDHNKTIFPLETDHVLWFTLMHFIHSSRVLMLSLE